MLSQQDLNTTQLKTINSVLKALTQDAVVIEARLISVAKLVYAMDKRVRETRNRLTFLVEPKKELTEKCPKCISEFTEGRKE